MEEKRLKDLRHRTTTGRKIRREPSRYQPPVHINEQQYAVFDTDDHYNFAIRNEEVTSSKRAEYQFTENPFAIHYQDILESKQSQITSLTIKKVSIPFQLNTVQLPADSKVDHRNATHLFQLFHGNLVTSANNWFVLNGNRHLVPKTVTTISSIDSQNASSITVVLAQADFDSFQVGDTNCFLYHDTNSHINDKTEMTVSALDTPTRKVTFTCISTVKGDFAPTRILHRPVLTRAVSVALANRRVSPGDIQVTPDGSAYLVRDFPTSTDDFEGEPQRKTHLGKFENWDATYLVRLPPRVYPSLTLGDIDTILEKSLNPPKVLANSTLQIVDDPLALDTTIDWGVSDVDYASMAAFLADLKSKIDTQVYSGASTVSVTYDEVEGRFTFAKIDGSLFKMVFGSQAFADQMGFLETTTIESTKHRSGSPTYFLMPYGHSTPSANRYTVAQDVNREKLFVSVIAKSYRVPLMPSVVDGYLAQLMGLRENWPLGFETKHNLISHMVSPKRLLLTVRELPTMTEYHITGNSAQKRNISISGYLAELGYDSTSKAYVLYSTVAVPSNMITNELTFELYHQDGVTRFNNDGNASNITIELASKHTTNRRTHTRTTE